MVLRAVVTDLVERDPTMKERVLYKLQAMLLAPFSSDEQKALEHSIKYFESLYVAPNPKIAKFPKGMILFWSQLLQHVSACAIKFPHGVRGPFARAYAVMG